MKAVAVIALFFLAVLGANSPVFGMTAFAIVASGAWFVGPAIRDYLAKRKKRPPE